MTAQHVMDGLVGARGLTTAINRLCPHNSNDPRVFKHCGQQ